MRFGALGFGSAFLCVVVACGETSGKVAPASEDGSIADGGAPLDVVWTPCKLRTSNEEAAECATVSVPLRWNDPAGKRLSIAVTRYHPAGVATRGQFWVLQGGPGASSATFDGIGPYFAKLGVALDFYLVEQRGTGRSARLGCADQESTSSPGGVAITDDEWPGCLESVKSSWQGGLDGFSVTNTAKDLGALIDATRAPGQEVFVYGVSYGTYLLNRYLALFPAQPTGVIFDSICGPDVCRSSQADVRFNDVAKTYFDTCGADAFCAARLGKDAWARFGAVLDGLDQGACPAATSAGLDRAGLKRAFAQLLYDWDRRALIVAMVRRLERCSAKDEPVFAHFGKLLRAPATVDSLAEFSTVLGNHVALSELWDEPSPSAAEFDAQDRTTYVSNVLGPKLARLHDSWPRVPHDEYWNRWATTSAAVLMMNGSLDPATPLAIQGGAKTAFTGEHQTFVTIPGASHGALLNSPVTTAGETPCGASLVASFLESDGSAVDTSCITRLAPPTFDHAKATQDFFGTSDLWGD